MGPLGQLIGGVLNLLLGPTGIVTSLLQTVFNLLGNL
jgi:hypothetical protein